MIAWLCVCTHVCVCVQTSIAVVPIQNNRIKDWCLIRCLFVYVCFIVMSTAEATVTQANVYVCARLCAYLIVMNMAEGMALSLLIKEVEG